MFTSPIEEVDQDSVCAENFQMFFQHKGRIVNIRLMRETLSKKLWKDDNMAYSVQLPYESIWVTEQIVQYTYEGYCTRFDSSEISLCSQTVYSTWKLYQKV